MKKLTAENWLEPEPITRLLYQRGRDDREFRQMFGEDWVKVFTEPALVESVPEEVRGLFETARGALVYGYFFYPLYALGMGQLFRVAEAAVTHKCKAMEAPSGVDNFYRGIAWLTSRAIIPPQEQRMWDAIRELRNIESHPERQTFLTPGAVADTLIRIAEAVNALYGATGKDSAVTLRGWRAFCGECEWSMHAVHHEQAETALRLHEESTGHRAVTLQRMAGNGVPPES